MPLAKGVPLDPPAQSADQVGRNTAPAARSGFAQCLPDEPRPRKLESASPMNTPTSSAPNPSHFRLHLSTPAEIERAKEEEAQRAAKRRKYWQDYKDRVKRVFGTLPPDEHATWKAEAEANDRSLWDHIISQARAYRQQTIVPTQQIEAQQRQLIMELRRVGNNLNQLARLAHIKAHQQGGLKAPVDDLIGREVMRNLERWEAKLLVYDPAGTGAPAQTHVARHDH